MVFYIPVVGRYSGECIFTPDDYQEMRNKLSGLKIYGMEEYNFAEDADLVTQRSAEIFSQLDEMDAENAAYRQEIEAKFAETFEKVIPNFSGLKERADGDLTSGYVELISIGSTARGTNRPGGGMDFDYIARIDANLYNDEDSKREIESRIVWSFAPEDFLITPNGVRMKGAQVNGRAVDVDVSLVQRTNRMRYAENQSLADRFEAMREQNPMREKLVRANIIQAKEVLGAAKAYLPSSSNEAESADEKGGMGGVGVEEWILQNGGSFKNAAKSFVEAAEKVQNIFNKFRYEYHVWGAGENYFAVRNNEHIAEKPAESQRGRKLTHDDYISTNMDKGGFERTVAALRQFLAEEAN